MKKSTLYYIWLGAFVVCFLFSLIEKPSAPLQVVMTIFSLGFFAPPVCLFVKAKREQDKKSIKMLRIVAILSLALTLLLFILNIMSMAWSEAAGNFLYYVLTFVSVPAVCCKSWALSLFLWGCLLSATFLKDQK